MADHDQQYLVELDGNQPVAVLEKVRAHCVRLGAECRCVAILTSRLGKLASRDGGLEREALCTSAIV